jgi:uncharacterized protein (DUF1501 family)
VVLDGQLRLPHDRRDAAELHRDPVLATSFQRGLETERMAAAQGMRDVGTGSRGGPDSAGGMRQIAEGAARLMAADDGPRIAALAFEGWDTHANEGGATGRLAQLLGGLDGALAVIETGLGERWKDTAVVVVTEFGRTARVNGTTGTDHGTGTVAFLAGGAVKGGRVMADWPGLRPEHLHEGRDLNPTTDLRSVLKGALTDLFGVSARALAEDIFPRTQGLEAIRKLIS